MLDQAQKLRNLVSSESGPVTTPRLITVTSGKGGVGKSNFVVNLSIALVNMGKRVLILDADVGMGNDDILMGFCPKYNLYDIIFNNKEIEEVIITAPCGVKLLPAGTGINKLDELTEQQRDYFVSKLSKIQDVDFIIMDTGAGINRSVLGFIACCEELIIVTTPEPTALTDAYSLLKAVKHFRIKSSAQIVVNKSSDTSEGLATFNKFDYAVSKFLKSPLQYLGCISDDKKVITSVKNQEPFLIGFPNCNASKDVKNIASKLVGTVVEDKSLGIDGLFKKIFNIFS
jgi:flagellar biosynthesis protein FlhG